MNAKQYFVFFLCAVWFYNGAFSFDGTVLSEEVTDGFSFVSSPDKSGKQWRIDGEKAQFLLNGDIQINGVRAEIFGKDEKHYFLFMDKARVSRDFKYIISDSHVRIVRGDIEITGAGLEWEADKSIAVIKKNVRVIFTREEGRDFLK